MKIWQEFGSSHSANITVIGTFESEESAKQAFDVLEDFVNASWEERYESVKDFRRKWEAKLPNLQWDGLSEEDFDTGVDNSPSINLDGEQVTITDFRSENIKGIIKLMFRLNKKKVEITGQGI